MTTADMKHIESSLKTKREELISTIRGTASKLALETTEADLLDRIQGMVARDESAIMLNRFSATLENVDRTLKALSEGNYGVCAMCEEPISDKRLKTIPWAQYCVHCQEQIEQGGTGYYLGDLQQHQPALEF